MGVTPNPSPLPRGERELWGPARGEGATFPPLYVVTDRHQAGERAMGVVTPMPASPRPFLSPPLTPALSHKGRGSYGSRKRRGHNVSSPSMGEDKGEGERSERSE